MKVIDLLLEYKTPKKPKARPKKTLWFNDSAMWKNDLDFARPGHKVWQSEEEEAYYAGDSEGNLCYGAWYPKKNAGVTFAAPRPRHTLAHPRVKFREWKNPQGPQ